MSIFGRPEPKEEIGTAELELRLNACFDKKVQKLSAKTTVMERELAQALSAFGSAIQKASKSDFKPNMDYLYRINDANVRTQKQSYTASILRIISAKLAISNTNAYYAAESIANSYEDLIMKVMSTNSTFKPVLLAYANELASAKTHFNAMERMCKELRDELAACTQQFDEYKEIEKKVAEMLEIMSKIDFLKLLQPGKAKTMPHEDAADRQIAAMVSEREKEFESVRKLYDDTNMVLAGMLLPIERIARMHDHASASKRKIIPYIEDPRTAIKSKSDEDELNRQISEMIDEVKTGKFAVKSKEDMILLLEAIRNANLLAMVGLLHQCAADMRAAEADMKKLKAQLHEIEEAKDEEERILNRKDEVERALQDMITSAHTKGSEIERLFSSCYKKNVVVKIDV